MGLWISPYRILRVRKQTLPGGKLAYRCPSPESEAACRAARGQEVEPRRALEAQGTRLGGEARAQARGCAGRAHSLLAELTVHTGRTAGADWNPD